MTEKEQQPVTPEIPTEAADKPESDNPPKNENRRGANQTERERTIAQNRQRLREIVDVVRKHDILHGITPEKLCAIIEDLGPTFIKLGQILSMRSDILPRDYCEALKKLRSNVSPMPFEQVQRVVETSYGCPMEEVFASFDEKALGSASIAQAHAAILKSGESVVVKVQREGIHEVMSRDIILLKQACKVLKYTPAGSLVDFNQVLDEMWVVAQEEMNFQTETANLERFHALNQDVVFVTSPILYRAYTTTNVLVMERIDVNSWVRSPLLIISSIVYPRSYISSSEITHFIVCSPILENSITSFTYFLFSFCLIRDSALSIDLSDFPSICAIDV